LFSNFLNFIFFNPRVVVELEGVMYTRESTLDGIWLSSCFLGRYHPYCDNATAILKVFKIQLNENKFCKILFIIYYEHIKEKYYYRIYKITHP
jgi:hypothetical protein